MLEIHTSSIVNTVRFQVSKEDIAEAKKAADDLQRHFSKIKDPKIRFQAQRARRQSAREKWQMLKRLLPKRPMT